MKKLNLLEEVKFDKVYSEEFNKWMTYSEWKLLKWCVDNDFNVHIATSFIEYNKEQEVFKKIVEKMIDILVPTDESATNELDGKEYKWKTQK